MVVANDPLSLNSSSLANIPLSPETAQDQERRIRREIANSNERRRMQSINAGFQSLKTLLPHTDGEKLSKVPKPHRAHAVPVKPFTPSSIFPLDLQAAILQQTAEYIFTLEQEKTQLLAQNNQLKRFIQVCEAFFDKCGINHSGLMYKHAVIKLQRGCWLNENQAHLCVFFRSSAARRLRGGERRRKTKASALRTRWRRRRWRS